MRKVIIGLGIILAMASNSYASESTESIMENKYIKAGLIITPTLTVSYLIVNEIIKHISVEDIEKFYTKENKISKV